MAKETRRKIALIFQSGISPYCNNREVDCFVEVVHSFHCLSLSYFFILLLLAVFVEKGVEEKNGGLVGNKAYDSSNKCDVEVRVLGPTKLRLWMVRNYPLPDLKVVSHKVAHVGYHEDRHNQEKDL